LYVETRRKPYECNICSNDESIYLMKVFSLLFIYVYGKFLALKKNILENYLDGKLV
jgi:hypothetical protein